MAAARGAELEFLSGASERLNYARSCELFVTYRQPKNSGFAESMIAYLASILPPDIPYAFQTPDIHHELDYPSWSSWSAILAWFQHLDAETFNVTKPGDNHVSHVLWDEYSLWRVAEADPVCMERACLLMSTEWVNVDPDLAGIGVSGIHLVEAYFPTTPSNTRGSWCQLTDAPQVLSSYCMEASLVTMFFFVLVLLPRLRRGQTASLGSLVISRLVDIHRGSLYDMFLGSSILCFGIQLATIRLYRVNDSDTIIYVIVNSLVSSFAFLPFLALCCLMDTTQVRIRNWFCRTATFLLYCMWVAVVLLTTVKRSYWSFLSLFMEPTYKVLGQIVGEIKPNLQNYCNYQFNASISYLKLAVVCVWAVMLMPPGMYLIIGMVRLVERLRGSTTHAASRLTSRFFHFVLPVFCLVGMWTVLGLILYIRGVLTAASRDELSTIEINKWEVGQILATLTWIPVVVEMGRIAAGKHLTRSFFDLNEVQANLDNFLVSWVKGHGLSKCGGGGGER
ncbi:hypothetical protein PG993_012416 [Apiospora rasikravindrae]|uniref:Uncharacterized protein n=1 Tax=Apiospora rasikravindrae TaxID=990691 RepID=A0ABR1S3T5_9PEZI